MNEQKLFDEVLKLRAVVVKLEDSIIQNGATLGMNIGMGQAIARHVGLENYLKGVDLLDESQQTDEANQNSILIYKLDGSIARQDSEAKGVSPLDVLLQHLSEFINDVKPLLTAEQISSITNAGDLVVTITPEAIPDIQNPEITKG